MKMNFITTCITFLFLWSCTKKELPPVKSDIAVEPQITMLAETPGGSATVTATVTFDDKAHLKMITGNLKFLGSLEKEVLKLLLEAQAPEINQFEVLTYGFDKLTGVKTGFLPAFGCQKVAVKPSAKKFEIFSECIRPAKKLAELIEGPKNHYSILFLTANWKVILGNAAGLNPDRVCDFVLKDNKVQSLDCKNTVFSPKSQASDINYYELKIKKYIFNRNQTDELVVEGGQYKDLIETKKISMTVPMSGKISIIEKELKVKDDFAEMQNKLLGLEEEKKDGKEEVKEEGRKEESIEAQTGEPEYINEEGEQAVSGTEEIPQHRGR